MSRRKAAQPTSRLPRTAWEFAAWACAGTGIGRWAKVVGLIVITLSMCGLCGGDVVAQIMDHMP